MEEEEYTKVLNILRENISEVYIKNDKEIEEKYGYYVSYKILDVRLMENLGGDLLDLRDYTKTDKVHSVLRQSLVNYILNKINLYHYCPDFMLIKLAFLRVLDEKLARYLNKNKELKDTLMSLK